MPFKPVLVQPAEPSPVEKVRRRVRAMARPTGMLQCPECGSRSVADIRSGVIVTERSRTRGAQIIKDACAECWKRGNTVQMRTGLEKPKPAT